MTAAAPLPAIVPSTMSAAARDGLSATARVVGLRRQAMRFRVAHALVGPLCAALVLIDATAFLHRAESARDRVPEAADAVVVFSGEPQRVRRGVQLVRDGWARRLFLAGNDNGSEDLRQRALYPALFACCAETVPGTRNTDDDADATRRWAEAGGYTSLIVVTSFSHMPRVLLELRQRLPRVRLVPSVIIVGNRDWTAWQDDPALWRIMGLEFAKFVRAQIVGLPGPVF